MMKKNDILKKIMSEKKITIADLSKSTGISYTTIKSLLDSDLSKSSYRNVCALCHALGLTTDQLEMLAEQSPTQLPLTLLSLEIQDFSDSEYQMLQNYIRYIRFLRTSSLQKEHDYSGSHRTGGSAAP